MVSRHIDVTEIGLYVETNARKMKWLIGCSYNFHKTLIPSHFKKISKNLDINSSCYDKFIHPST